MARHMTVLAAIAGVLAISDLAHAQPLEPAAVRKELVASAVLMQPQGAFERSLQRITILTAHGLLRLHGRLGSRRPYLEAVGGIKGFSAEANTRVGTCSCGAGAGIQFPLSHSTIAGPGKRELYGVCRLGTSVLRRSAQTD